MLKLLIVFPVLVVASIVLEFRSDGILAAAGRVSVMLAIGLTIGALFLVLRVLAVVAIGIGGVLLAGAGVVAMIVGGAFAIAVAAVFLHLFLPILLIAGIGWLIHRAAKPAQIATV